MRIDIGIVLMVFSLPVVYNTKIGYLESISNGSYGVGKQDG